MGDKVPVEMLKEDVIQRMMEDFIGSDSFTDAMIELFIHGKCTMHVSVDFENCKMDVEVCSESRSH